MRHRSKLISIFLAGLLAGSLMVGPVGAHFVENTKHLGRHAWKQFIKERVYTRSQTNKRFLAWPGRKVLNAKVDVTGTSVALVEGKGATGVTRSGPGKYRVTFNRGVVGCMKHITSQQVRPPDNSIQSEVSQFHLGVFANTQKTVRVARANSAGNFADFADAQNGFVLTLFC